MSGAELHWNALRSLVQARRAAPPLTAMSRVLPLRASFAQESLWIHQRISPASTAYNLAVACRLRGELDVDALGRSLDALTRRHEILRTTLCWQDGQLLQRIHEPSATPLSVENIDAATAQQGAASIDAIAKQWAANHAERLFDLERGPLFVPRLAKVADHDHCLLLCVHHSIFDAWSFELLMGELCATYNALRADRRGAEAPPRLDGLECPQFHYADFAAWQRTLAEHGHFERSLAYWDRLPDVLPRVELATDHPRSPRRSRHGRSCELTFDASLTSGVRALCGRLGGTPYVIALAALKALLHRHTGQPSILVGSPISGRTSLPLQNLLGMVTNTVPMLTSLDGDPTFRELVTRVHETVAGALEHQDVPLALLARARQQDQPGSAFDVLFAFQNVPQSQWSWDGLACDAWNIPPRTARCDLTLTMQEIGTTLRVLAEYDASLFDEQTIASLLRQLSALLASASDNPEQRISRLAILSSAERTALLEEWSRRTAPRPTSSIHELFEVQVRRAPAAIALVAGSESWSYATLNARANQLARLLVTRGAGPGTSVAIDLQRSPELVVAMLSILKTGAAYVPLDHAAPDAWQSPALGLAVAVVCDVTSAGRHAPGRVVHVDDPGLRQRSTENLGLAGGPEDVAYVMFTSGTTGVPRGVRIPHRGVVRLVHGASYVRPDPVDVFLQLAPAAFDASTFEIWTALLTGARLVIAPPHALSMTELRDVIDTHAVSTLWLTAGLFERFVDSGAAPRSLRHLVTGGDVVSPVHASRFLRESPHCCLVNGYGPTENTTFTTTHVIDAADPDRPIPIGRPIQNTEVYVLDEDLEPVPPGMVGEAVVGGDGLALGYDRSTDLDESNPRQRFVASPFATGETLYRTGDRVRQRHDGTLEFHGRIDEQHKIRGHRVELTAVEAMLRTCPLVRAVGVAVDGDGSAKQLVAAIVPRVTCSPESQNEHEDGITRGARNQVIDAVRDTARTRLPAYMVPSRIVVVDALPLTANGKLDRGALATVAVRPPTGSTAPRDELERSLVALFRAALKREIGIDDSFFEAGGDSLRAVELVMAIEQELGHVVPLGAFYETATVAALAEWLRSRTHTARDLGPHVLPLRDGAVVRPLFLVAGGRGGVREATIIAKLVTGLRSDQATFALLAPRLHSMHAMAAQLVEEIIRIQPRGPYRLGGQCSGGCLALEMAQLLRARGEQIELLLLIDSWRPSHLGTANNILWYRPRSLIKAGLAFLADVSRRPAGSEPWLRELWTRAWIPRVERRHMWICQNYRPDPYDGNAILLGAEGSLRRNMAAPWRALIRNLEVRTMRGDQETFFKVHWRDSAERLRACVEGDA